MISALLEVTVLTFILEVRDFIIIYDYIGRHKRHRLINEFD